jgi:copper chaperone CopZ
MSKINRNGFSLVPGDDNDEPQQQHIEQVVPPRSRSAGRQSLASMTPPIMPPPPPLGSSAQGGVYPPDFMYCGICVSCHEPDSIEIQLGGGKKLQRYLSKDDSVSSSTASTIAFLETRFQLRNSTLNPSESLVIQSILQPLPGVSNVSVDCKHQCIEVEHDASMNNEIVLNALESSGHSAFIQASVSSSSGEEQWVRSQFYVSGICCTTEVPVVKRILRTVAGVSKLQINITTKIVHVQHDVFVTSAQKIAQKLSSEGFPTQIQRDGHAQSQAKHEALHQGQTTLIINGDVSEQDRPIIEHKLSQLEGVIKIGLNVTERLILIDHDVYQVSSGQFVKQLQPSFECDVITAGEKLVNDDTARTLDGIMRSRYVESTIAVERLDSHGAKNIENAIFQTYIHNEVRAIYPNVISETIKIEHDPNCVSIEEVVDILARYDSKAVVTLDGAVLNLYLPAESDYPSQHMAEQDETSLIKIHLNVWLSGVFWVLSMLSYKQGL